MMRHGGSLHSHNTCQHGRRSAWGGKNKRSFSQSADLTLVSVSSVALGGGHTFVRGSLWLQSLLSSSLCILHCNSCWIKNGNNLNNRARIQDSSQAEECPCGQTTMSPSLWLALLALWVLHSWLPSYNRRNGGCCHIAWPTAHG